MANLVETLVGIALLSAFIAGLAYIQSRSGAAQQEKFLKRMRLFRTIGAVSFVIGAILEILLQTGLL